jgi:hypothetical protein
MIRLTKHAAEAVEKRNLDTDWIERAITMPDFTAVDPHDVTLTRSFKAIEQVGDEFSGLCIGPSRTTFWW